MPRTPKGGGSVHAGPEIARARRYLSTGGVDREDSDDELGLEDHPWEWIYLTPSKGHLSKKHGSRGSHEHKKIIGARMGSFQCMLGDCVLLKAEGSKEAWVGLLCDFLEEDDEEAVKRANFMWFSAEKEIRNKAKKRTDALPVCLWTACSIQSNSYFRRMNYTSLRLGMSTP